VQLITTLGRKRADEVGMILPHEHVFADLRVWDEPGYAQAETSDVIDLMAPEIEKARDAGITAIVESTPVGVGRRADILKAVSEATRFPLLVPTGVYREPWIPAWIRAANEEELAEWMRGELQGEIEDTGVQAGWIKLGAGDDGLTKCESKVLRAAATAGASTNAVIGSHTVQGRVVQDQLDIVEEAGYAPERFVWIHADCEPDFDWHLRMAQRGAWIEYDHIGNDEPIEVWVALVRRALDSDLSSQLLLSHDRGWYDAGLPAGGTPKPFTVISDELLPNLREAGVDDATLHELTHTNPFRAFSR
jgi:phosphotriesterase-related protein